MLSVSRLGFPLFAFVLAFVWYKVPCRRRWLALLAASTVFYLSLDVAGFLCLLASSWCVWYCTGRLKGPKSKWLLPGLIAALGPLTLKYYGPAVAALQRWWGIRLWDGKNILIPFGLAYFTLQLAGYLLDVYTGRVQPEPKFARVLCYASFFLSITQGPFNHYDALMAQIDAGTSFDTRRLWYGAVRMFGGYCKKMVVAEAAALIVNTVFAVPANFNSSQLIFALFLFAVQLYADFSGYTDIVLGAGEMLGLTLPENFRQPYLAKTISEFWDRWHMSLSSWLNERLFNPVALKSRRAIAKYPKQVRKKIKNLPLYNALLITFLVSGLWHGVGLQFLVWGILNGLYQIAGTMTQRARQKIWEKTGLAESWLHKIWKTVFTFALVMVSYVFFRADSVAAAIQYLLCMVRNPGLSVLNNYVAMGIGTKKDLAYLIFSIALLFLIDAVHEHGVHLRATLEKRPLWIRWLVYEAAIFSFLLMGHFSLTTGFLYENF